MYCEDRLSKLDKFGFPNSISQATANSEYFPTAYVNDLGYWAYTRFKSFIPTIPDVLFFAGDPICENDNKELFIEDVISSIKKNEFFSAIQVHYDTAKILQKQTKLRCVPHQFGPETQVPLPYSLNGQVGTKVRQCLKEGLQVEELVFREQEVDTNSEQINLDVSMLIETCKREKNKIPEKDFSKENYFFIESKGDLIIPKIQKYMAEIKEATGQSCLTEFLLKIERFLKDILPSDVLLFFQTNDLKRNGEIIRFGFFQKTQIGFNQHSLLFLKKDQIVKKLLLRSGKKLISENDVRQLKNISDAWLKSKLTKREMGPPLLKPFKAIYEPNRRLFVARDPENNIIGFVDFDPVNWKEQKGCPDINKTGYYTNLIRTKQYVNDQNEIIYKHVRFMIIAAAAERFSKEGFTHLNLGLNPFSHIVPEDSIQRNNRLSFIESIAKFISSNSFLNNITFRFSNVMATKQRNWSKKINVQTYMIFSGNIIQQSYQLFSAFITTGALTTEIFQNLYNYIIHRKN